MNAARPSAGTESVPTGKAQCAMVQLHIDGQSVSAQTGETLLQVARRAGATVPTLCFKEGMRPDGNCRACVVEVAGERTLTASCCRLVADGLAVDTMGPRVAKNQAMVLELLLADMPDAGYKWNDGVSTADATPDATPGAGLDTESDIGQHGELSHWAARLGVTVRSALRANRRASVAPDLSHPAMAVNLDACIQCTRCVRACREVQVNDVIGMARRGADTQVVFDLNDALAASTCVACGECVQACPTGALMPKTLLGSQAVDKSVDSVCPYCGVGCLITYKVKGNAVVGVDGRDGPANHGRLCVKGRFGFDYAGHPARLTAPLIRLPGAPKRILDRVAFERGEWRDVFREATWDEALDAVAAKFLHLRDQHGGPAAGVKALAGFGSAKGSNEEAYLFQKLVRCGFGSNNVDHCTRLCHASSVAALLEGVGSGAVSNPVSDVQFADVIVVIGANPTSNHPVAATWMKNAAKAGAKIIVADPRRTDLARHAWRVMQFKSDTDVALLNGMLHVILNDPTLQSDAALAQFRNDRTQNAQDIEREVASYTPQAVETLTGISAELLVECALAFANAKSAMILWGMGVSQHVHGTDNARCLIALSALAGQIGKPGSGLHPLRGQNNVQGASDAGLIPMMLPNYQRVTDAASLQWFESFWQTPLDAQPGYTVVEVMHKILAPPDDPHRVRGMWVMGENPAMSDPDLGHARLALASLEHLVVQDIFMTETAWLADVVLPASAWPEKTGTVTNTDRMVQLGRRALELPAHASGDLRLGARADLWIIQQLAQRMGLHWPYSGEEHGVAAVYEEMRQAMHASIAGITWARLEREGSVTYPCPSESEPGQAMVFADRFATQDGKARLVPARYQAAPEQPDADFPFTLITGRQLEHWHTGSMTRRASVLDELEPEATVAMHPHDIAAQQFQVGQTVRLRTRRGHVVAKLRLDAGLLPGTVFMPFAYAEAAANVLTSARIDPVGKIPGFKFSAVAVEAAPAGTEAALLGETTGQSA